MHGDVGVWWAQSIFFGYEKENRWVFLVATYDFDLGFWVHNFRAQVLLVFRKLLKFGLNLLSRVSSMFLLHAKDNFAFLLG
ncbi:hypothetical protein SCA6_016038 [Theobroma cacao]